MCLVLGDALPDETAILLSVKELKREMRRSQSTHSIPAVAPHGKRST
jgi:hypothetical protein